MRKRNIIFAKISQDRSSDRSPDRSPDRNPDRSGSWKIRPGKSRLHIVAGVVLTISLLLSSSALTFAAGDVTPEVKELLDSSYVEPVSTDVLNAGSVDEMLELLDDPYTAYFSAEEYQSFIDSLDLTFSGIGIYMDIVPEGVLVTSVIAGSPAEEVGIQEEDIIVSADGQSLAGLAAEVAASYLKGPEGSMVDLELQRGTENIQVRVTRRAIEVPTVTGEVLDGHIGYIEIVSFGSTTPQLFDEVVQELKWEGVDSWIIDLRDNPGGYLSSALDLAGYFIGWDTAVQIKERDRAMTPYLSYKQAYVLEEPIIFLTNNNSASASEILAAAVKDQEKATLVGTTTYGKGTVQSIYELSDGGALKMTVARFYSPDGKEINKTGVSPDLKVEKADSLMAARLLLAEPVGSSTVGARVKASSYGINSNGYGIKSHSYGLESDSYGIESGSTVSGNYSGYIALEAGPNSFEVALTQARTEEYWAAWSEILDSVTSASALKQGTVQGWQSVSDSELQARWPLYYPGYQAMGELSELPQDKKFTVRFNGPVDWDTVTDASIELIESTSGERVPLTFLPLNERELHVVPQEQLKQGTEYWLVIHPSIKGTDGKAMVKGTVTVAETAGSQAAVSTVWSAPVDRKVFGLEGQQLQGNGRGAYGQAIWVK